MRAGTSHQLFVHGSLPNLHPGSPSSPSFYPPKPHSSRFLPQPTPAKDASSSCTARGNPQPAACHPGQAPGHFCIPTGPQPHQEFNLARSLAHHPTKGTKAPQSSPFTTGLAEMAPGRGWEEKCEQCGCRRAKRLLLLGRAPCPPLPRSQARAGCAPAQPQTKPPGQGARLPAAPRGLPPLLLPVCSSHRHPGREMPGRRSVGSAAPSLPPLLMNPKFSLPPRLICGKSSAPARQPPPRAQPGLLLSSQAAFLCFTAEKIHGGFPREPQWLLTRGKPPALLQEHLRAFRMLFSGHTAHLRAATATPAHLSPATAPSSAPFPGQKARCTSSPSISFKASSSIPNVYCTLGQDKADIQSLPTFFF